MTLQIPLDHLSATIPDGVLRPGDPEYVLAATTPAGEGSPDLVVRPRLTPQVASVVRFARGYRLPLTVRAGGHSIAGLTTVDRGLLLDLRLLDTVDVDPTTRLVRVGGGATWGAVAQALRPHGLGLTAGDTASVGVGGLTLGGGIGWMVRRYGLAVDHLVGAEVVTASGAVVHASPEEHPDLFWALRGGGGGLGVVTRFDFRAHPVTDVVFGTVTFALDDPFTVLTAWRDRQRAADERLTTTLTLVPPTEGRPAVAVLGLCLVGEAADAALDPFRTLGPVLGSDVAVRPYADVLADTHHPAGGRPTMRTAFLPELDDAAAAHIAALASGTVVSLRGLGGALGRVPADASAFAHRDAETLVTAVSFGGGAEHLTGRWTDIARRGTGSYVNFLSETGDAAVSAAYPPATRERLSRVREAYDPTGVFAGAVRP